MFQLVPQTHLTDETEFDHCENVGDTDSKQRRATQRTEGWTDRAVLDHHKGEKKQTRLKDQVAMWPTATARDYKGGRAPETPAKAGRNETNSLPDAVNAQMGKIGS